MTDAAAGLAIDGVRLEFGRDGGRHLVLDNVSLALPAGASIGIGGPSGSGKSSLLLLLAGILLPTAGQIAWGGVTLGRLDEGARDRWRRRHVGLVLQDFHLVDGMSALANVLLPAGFERLRVPADLRARARALLDRVGLRYPDRSVSVMSRGEQQRVALARSLLFRPPILLADEPTASLDRASADTVADLLVGSAAEAGATLVVASHDRGLLDRLGRRLRLDEGRLDPEGGATG